MSVSFPLNEKVSRFKIIGTILLLTLIFVLATNICYGKSEIGSKWDSFSNIAKARLFQSNTTQSINFNINNNLSALNLKQVIFSSFQSIFLNNIVPRSNGQSHSDEADSHGTTEESDIDTAAGGAEVTTDDKHEHGEGFWHSLVIPLGITTFSFLLLTILSGLFRKKLGRKFMIIHPILAYITLGLGVCHALLVILT